MTKKSLGRQQRDAAKKKTMESMVWDDVMSISWRCRQMLQTHIGVTVMSRYEQLRNLVQDQRLLAQNLTILARDLGDMHTELMGLYKLHETRSGNPTDIDDGVLAIDIHEKYLLWTQKHDSVVLPIASHILEQFSQAEAELQKTNPELVTQIRAEVSNAMAGVMGGRQMVPTKNITPEQDPGIITDVEVKA